MAGNLRLLVEGLVGDDGAARPPAHVDLELGALRRAIRGQVGHADADAQAGRERPAGHLPAAHDGVALARDAGPDDLERDELLGRPLLARAAHRVAADEAGLLL